MSPNNSPAYCFTIPSLVDSTSLDCRIYHPDSLQGSRSTRLQHLKGALVAHPYAPLGGCMDDPVVTAVVDQLLSCHFVVGTFNLRGAANSQGSTSWTGKGERDDYISVAAHLIFYLHQLREPDSGPGTPVTPPSHTEPPPCSSSSGCITLILAGYSYGSLVVSHLPSTAEILALFHQPRPSTPISEILLRAKELALQTNTLLSDRIETRGRPTNHASSVGHRKSNSQHSITFGGSESPSKIEQHHTSLVHKSIEAPIRLKNAIQNHKHSPAPVPSSPLAFPGASSSLNTATIFQTLPHVLTHYLLISPLLPPLSSILSFSASSLLFWRPPANKTDNLIRNPTFAVFGTEDMFTSSHKLDQWCKKMDGLSSHAAGPSGHSSFRWKIVDGASHFWRERGVEAQLVDGLREWVEEDVVHRQDD